MSNLAWTLSYNGQKHGFTMNEIKERLQKSVELLRYKIKNFDEEKLTTEEGNIEYNRLIIKKAVLSQKLKPQPNKHVHSLIDKILRKLKGKTLICDRF